MATREILKDALRLQNLELEILLIEKNEHFEYLPTMYTIIADN